MKNFFLLFLLLFSPLVAKEIVVDLKDAHYEEGVLSTHSGGVLLFGCMRIQAQNIRYVHEEKVCAQGKVLVLYGQKIMAGEQLVYDFKKSCGTIYNGVLTEFPVVIGAKKIHLLPNDTYELEDSFVTLCETDAQDFSINSKKLCISKNNEIIANDIFLRFFSVPLFTISSLKTHASVIGDIPVSTTFTAGGVEGSYVTLRYRMLTHEDLNVYLRADYVLGHGPGGGVDIDYCCKPENRFFHAKNFIVQDRSYDDPKNRARYRFEGRYDECFPCQNTEASLTYDFLSDSEMASDFSAKEFDLDTGLRTEFLLWRKEHNWALDFATRVRVNDFQTVNQELPALKGNMRPLSLGYSGCIFDTRLKAAYLNYVYASGTPNVNNFQATRIEVNPCLYRPIALGKAATLTPQAEVFGIFYGNNPQERAAQQFVAKYGAHLSTNFYRYFGSVKHVVEPYAEYENWTFPTVNFDHYFVFNINDGYTGLQWLRFGIANSFYKGCSPTCIKKLLYINLWAYRFFNMHTMYKQLPKIYGSAAWYPFDCLKGQFDFAWNLETHSPEYMNLHHLWTIDENLAFNFDILSRGSRAWRKADPTNFMLDAFWPEAVLESSELSDRRITLLTHSFWRFHPNWSFEAETRWGWHRTDQPAYFEYQLDLATILGCNWNLKFSFEHREIDNRFFISFKLGTPCP